MKCAPPWVVTNEAKPVNLLSYSTIQLSCISFQPMPLMSTAIGLPTGPRALALASVMVMSVMKADWVRRRPPCWATTSCEKPKSSGAVKVAVKAPEASLFTAAIR